MEFLSQLDVANPDHVSVITREGRVTISVRKDGADVTVGFPVNTRAFDTTPRPPLQQTVPVIKSSGGSPQPQTKSLSAAQRMEKAARFNTKLDARKVREIKDMLTNKLVMCKFTSKQNAYNEIGRIYGVSNHTIRQIHLGNAWKHVWLLISRPGHDVKLPSSFAICE